MSDFSQQYTALNCTIYYVKSKYTTINSTIYYVIPIYTTIKSTIYYVTLQCTILTLQYITLYK